MDNVDSYWTEERMKVTLEYDLPEEQFEYDVAAKGHDLYRALSDYRNELRAMRKHGDPINYSGYEMLEWCWKKLHEYTEELGLDL